MHRFVLLATALSLGLAASARGQTVLTLEDTIARARVAAAPVLIARARIAEAEAAMVDASVRFRDNPVLDASAGPRAPSLGSRTTELDIGLSQQFETGGQRRARIAVAQAGVDRQRAAVDDVARLAVFDAAMAFLDGLAADARLRIAEEADSVSRELLRATERRHAAGDIAAIDVNLSRIEAARSAAALRAATADRTAAVGALRGLLRLTSEDTIELRGSLEFPAPAPLDGLRTALEQRADFAVIRAEAREAEAGLQLARALQKPDLGLRVAYEREETDTIVIGGLTIALPAFQRGHGPVAASAARASRAQLELETRRQTARADLETAYAVYLQHAELAAAFERDALPSSADNESLSRRSYDAGELNLMELLLVRRNALDTRMAMVDRRLDAARSRIRVDFAAGGLR
jgi:cobalt-zinc-cadmium efflux system outer membrane protein